MKCPIRVTATDGTCQNAETDPSYLCDVVVDPAWQHKGVGRALLEAIQTNPLFRDLRGILVSRDAQPFYAKFGFEKSDRGMVKPAKES